MRHSAARRARNPGPVYRICRSARVVPSAAAGFCDQSSSANAAVAGPSLRARVSASCWRSEGWMDCRLVAFFSPETPRSCDRWNLASPGFGWRSLAASRFRALAGAPRRQPVPAPVLEAGEATSPLPDQSSVVANPDAHRGAQVLQRARGGPAFLHQGHRQDERVAHLRMALQFHLPEATAADDAPSCRR